jgi:DNA repair protein SbcC/Rad50
VRLRSGAVAAGLVDVMARLESARGGLGSRLASVGVFDIESYEADRAATVAQVAATAATVAVLAGQVERQEASVAAAAETTAVASRLERLGRHLSSSGFPQYLLEERRRELADAASERFRQLSADRYGLCLVDEETAERHGLGRNEVNRFAVRDLHVGGRVRSAATLSGGERFLASLALALGLANLVAMDGGRLEAFFVDEGFGSLDADALDLAMEGVERLVADQPDRLVVVVSHVPEMRERILDLIVLDKEPGTGVTRVVRS